MLLDATLMWYIYSWYANTYFAIEYAAVGDFLRFY